MKLTPDPSLQNLSGRWTKKDSTVAAFNKKTGKHYQYIMRTDVKQPNSAAQQAVKTLFTQKAAAIAAWWRANKPSTSNPQGTEDYQHLMRNYDGQFNYGNPYCYARSLVDDDLKLHIGTTIIDLSGNVPEGGGNNPNPNPQGGGGGDEDPDGEGSLS